MNDRLSGIDIEDEFFPGEGAQHPDVAESLIGGELLAAADVAPDGQLGLDLRGGEGAPTAAPAPVKPRRPPRRRRVGNGFAAPMPWAEGWRAVPQELMRSPLFSPHRRANHYIDEWLPTNENVDLATCGEALTQFDLDIWAACIHLARYGDPVNCSVRDLLKHAGRTWGSTAPRRVSDSLQMLASTEIDLQVLSKKQHPQDTREVRYEYFGTFLKSAECEVSIGLRGMVSAIVPADMAVLFDKKRRSLVPAAHRQMLGDKPLAQWLYAYICTHQLPYDCGVAYYHRLSGSQSGLSEFAKRLALAAEVLVKKNLVHSARVDGGKLQIVRKSPFAKKGRALR